MENAFTFEKFMGISLKAFEKLGSKSATKSVWRPIAFWLSLTFLLIFIIFFRTFATDSDNESFTFLYVINDLTGYVVQAAFIIKGFLLLYLHHSKIQLVFKKLRDFFPKTVEEQKKFKVLGHWKPMRLRNACFLNFYIFNITLFTLFPLVATLHRKFFGDGVYEMVLAVKYRIEIDGMFVREFGAIFASLNNLISSSFSISFETLYVSTLSALCMQFEILDQKIQELDFKKAEAKEKFKALVNEHQQLIQLSDSISAIFSTTLFTNFVCGTMIVCFFGFEMLVSYSFIL